MMSTERPTAFPSRPVVERPDSVTHWTCPRSPAPGRMTHHMATAKNVCVYCGKDAQTLREEQASAENHTS